MERPVDIEAFGAAVGVSRGKSHVADFGACENCGRMRDELSSRTVALASAAHELSTPLAVIRGYAELLLSEKTGALTDRQREILGEMQSSQRRLSAFIRDFLTYSRFECAEIAVRSEPVYINACIREVYVMWLPSFERKQLALYLLAGENIPVAELDPLKVQHAVSNLLDNALRFTPKGGTVWIETAAQLWERRALRQPSPTDRRRRNDPEPNAIRVTVSDTGRGIAPEFHQEIFNDFFRASTGRAEPEGMGLGLAIARRLVQLHSGKIWVESALGNGSKFSMLLPLQVA